MTVQGWRYGSDAERMSRALYQYDVAGLRSLSPVGASWLGDWDVDQETVIQACG